MSFDCVNALFLRWLETAPRRLERAAAVRDWQALARAAPPRANRLRSPQLPEANALIEFTCRLVETLTKCILNNLGVRLGAPALVVPPFVGGVPQHELLLHGLASPVQRAPGEGFKVACLNPGRVGLSALGSNQVLHWRVQAIGCALEELDVDLCVLPGARFPPGAQLPESFPYAWVGVHSLSWAGVGALIRAEWESAVELLESVGSDRVLWLNVTGAREHLIVCAFYPAPGGDWETWSLIISEYGALSRAHPAAKFVLLGDGNIHLSCLVQHARTCACLHCRQSSVDARIEALIAAAGLHAITPPGPTHDSGTAVDFILAPRAATILGHICEKWIGLSDHKLVFCIVPLSVEATQALVLGKVAWSDDGWDAALLPVEPCLQLLAAAVCQLVHSSAMLPQMLGGTIPRKQRRALLDCAAWCRNVLYVTAGHCAGVVRCASGRPRAIGPLPTLNPDSFVSHAYFKAAVNRQVWASQQVAVSTYMRLRESKNPAAERFLSKCMQPRLSTCIALTEPGTGKQLSSVDMISTIYDDLHSRAQNSFPQDPAGAAATLARVDAIRRSGAVPAVWGQ